ncbi:hypothetical protein BKA56DRAFT_620083 [Ilyonectria sp. MPI-CAGE-AT-0026]|nr:hypothetical protein BKA56DRAFT_620083 [Ilyonectria sp. MPI-CAGE-AT-0026]
MSHFHSLKVEQDGFPMRKPRPSSPGSEYCINSVGRRGIQTVDHSVIGVEEQDHWAVTNVRSLVHPDDGVDDEGILAALVKGVGSPTRRYIAFHDGSDDDIEAEWMCLKSLCLATDVVSAASTKTALPDVPSNCGRVRHGPRCGNLQQNSTELPEDRSVVIFGHDARLGLQVEPEIELPETKGLRQARD